MYDGHTFSARGGGTYMTLTVPHWPRLMSSEPWTTEHKRAMTTSDEPSENHDGILRQSAGDLSAVIAGSFRGRAV